MGFAFISFGAALLVALASANHAVLRREVPEIRHGGDKHAHNQKIEQEAVWAERLERHDNHGARGPSPEETADKCPIENYEGMCDDTEPFYEYLCEKYRVGGTWYAKHVGQQHGFGLDSLIKELKKDETVPYLNHGKNNYMDVNDAFVEKIKTFAAGNSIDRVEADDRHKKEDAGPDQPLISIEKLAIATFY